jgi:hypothetical protein
MRYLRENAHLPMAIAMATVDQMSQEVELCGL